MIRNTWQVFMGSRGRWRCNLNSCLSAQRRGPNTIKAAQMKKQQRDRCSSAAFISWKYNISFRRAAPEGIPSSGTICLKSLVPIRSIAAAASLRRALWFTALVSICSSEGNQGTKYIHRCPQPTVATRLVAQSLSKPHPLLLLLLPLNYFPLCTIWMRRHAVQKSRVCRGRTSWLRKRRPRRGHHPSVTMWMGRS